MVIVDTSVWIDFLKDISNAETIWLNRRIEEQGVALTDLILAEVLQGIKDESVFKQVLRDLSNFTVFNSGGAELAVHAAQNYRHLRGKGHTVRKTVDCFIATFCVRGKHSLLHRDRDFDAFEIHLGLEVIHPRLN